MLQGAPVRAQTQQSHQLANTPGACVVTAANTFLQMAKRVRRCSPFDTPSPLRTIAFLNLLAILVSKLLVTGYRQAMLLWTAQQASDTTQIQAGTTTASATPKHTHTARAHTQKLAHIATQQVRNSREPLKPACKCLASHCRQAENFPWGLCWLRRCTHSYSGAAQYSYKQTSSKQTSSTLLPSLLPFAPHHPSLPPCSASFSTYYFCLLGERLQGSSKGASIHTRQLLLPDQLQTNHRCKFTLTLCNNSIKHQN